MAISKIRKISSTVLLVIAIIAIVVLALFFLGGYVDETAKLKEPVFTDLLLFTLYSVLILSVVVLIYFAIVGFGSQLKTNRKAAMTGLAAIVGLVVVLGVSYAIGSTNTLPLGPDAQKYNTAGYLKFSDMWLYTIYVMLFLNIIALLWTAFRNATSSKKSK